MKLIYPHGCSDEDIQTYDLGFYCNSNHYGMGHSQSEIESFLQRVREYVRADLFIVKKGNLDRADDSRLKNREFILRYGLWDRFELRHLLLSVSFEEFCHSIRGLDGSTLYVFSPERELYREGFRLEKVQIYLKEGEVRGRDGKMRVLVVSLHELEKPIVRLFEDWEINDGCNCVLPRLP